MSLFQTGKYKLHSGSVSSFKIECDALTTKDWEALAEQVDNIGIKFNFVAGIPKGGLKFAKALQKYAIIPKSKDGTLLPYLIVDDVLTTGTSMNQLRDKLLGQGMRREIVGIVLFARGECPTWIIPLFQMNSKMAS